MLYSEIIKEFTNRRDPKQERANRFKCIAELDISRGGTDDWIPLDNINNSITEDKVKSLKEEKTQEMVFLVTDGMTSNPYETQKLVKELIEKNVHIKKLEVGSGFDLYDDTWGENGIYLTDFSQLAPGIISLFKDFINKMKIKEASYDGPSD